MILVTGGAGYIGSHTVHQLVERQEEVVVFDNLYSGNRWSVPEKARLIVGDIRDKEMLLEIFKRYNFSAVIHFAAHLDVEESTREPLKYYSNNVLGTLTLLEACVAAEVANFIFSSTCAVYGAPKVNPVTELEDTLPINPYGKSKYFCENILIDMANTYSKKLNYIILRYFNVAGAKPNGNIGQSTKGSQQLVKVAAEVACGKRPSLSVFGMDYPTKDGTCIRDYIHVDDLANAHVLALDYLRRGGKSDVFNCGYGKGYTVLEVIRAMEKASSKSIPFDVKARRNGDATAIWADSTKIRKILDWKPKHDDLLEICKTAYEWERKVTKLV